MTDFEDYERLGSRSALLNALLVSWHIDVANTTTKQLAEPARTATEKFNESRSDVEDRMFEEYPDTDEFVFYGWGKVDENEAEELLEWVEDVLQNKL